MDWLLDLGVEEGLVECEKMWVKSWVILSYMYFLWNAVISINMDLMNKQLDTNSNPTSERISIYYAFLWSKRDLLNSEWDKKKKYYDVPTLIL